MQSRVKFDHTYPANKSKEYGVGAFIVCKIRSFGDWCKVRIGFILLGSKDGVPVFPAEGI